MSPSLGLKLAAHEIYTITIRVKCQKGFFSRDYGTYSKSVVGGKWWAFLTKKKTHFSLNHSYVYIYIVYILNFIEIIVAKIVDDNYHVNLRFAVINLHAVICTFQSRLAKKIYISLITKIVVYIILYRSSLTFTSY